MGVPFSRFLMRRARRLVVWVSVVFRQCPERAGAVLKVVQKLWGELAADFSVHNICGVALCSEGSNRNGVISFGESFSGWIRH